MRRLLLLCCAIVFLDTVFFAAITPLLPHFEDEYDLSKSGAGILAAAYPAGTFVGAIPGGYLAREGRRPRDRAARHRPARRHLRRCSRSRTRRELLVLARFVQGIGGAASWAGALAWVAGAAPRDRRGELIGTTMGAAVAGTIVGPAIGTLGDVIGIAPTFCGVAVLGVVLAAVRAAHAARRARGDVEPARAVGRPARRPRRRRHLADRRARPAVRDGRGARRRCGSTTSAPGPA